MVVGTGKQPNCHYTSQLTKRPGLYLTRHTWTPYLPDRVQDVLYNIPSSSTAAYTRLGFMSDVEGGFTSSTFDLADNITEGDSRSGLDAQAKRDIQRIMKSRGVGFDEARALHMQGRFKGAGIGKDGLPNDPKLVTFGGR